jgi:hypothetical protein
MINSGACSAHGRPFMSRIHHAANFAGAPVIFTVPSGAREIPHPSGITDHHP